MLDFDIEISEEELKEASENMAKFYWILICEKLGKVNKEVN